MSRREPKLDLPWIRGDFASFEDEHLTAPLGQQPGRGQAVVPRADDDDVEATHDAPDFIKVFAANSPGEPMMPPPG